MLLTIIALGLLAGCGAPSRTVKQQEQVVAQVEAQAKKKAMQQRLLTQVPQTPVKAYQDYQVGPEDLLGVQFFTLDELNRDVRVNGRGEISLPLVETVKVEGLTTQQVEHRLTELYEKRFLRNAQINVFVKEYRHQRVAVTGAVAKPGYHELIGPRTLLEALAIAGGLMDTASDVVHLIRRRSIPEPAPAVKVAAGATQSFSPDAETTVIDLRRLLMEGALELNFRVQNGDVIHVPFAGFAFVLGEVREPGKVPVKQELTVTQTVALAKGVTAIAAQNDISILRFDDQGQRITLKVALDRVTKGEDPDIPIKENDIVVVPDHLGKRTWDTMKSLIRGSIGIAYRPPIY
jgi:polysaccharide export outer membrane protein